MSIKRLKGKVINSDSRKVYVNALVSLFLSKRDFNNINETPSAVTSTDAEGEFSFDLESLGLVEKDTLFLQVQHPAGVCKNMSEEIKLVTSEEEEEEVIKNLYLHAPAKISNIAGTVFFFALLITLAATAYLYYNLHNTNPDNNTSAMIDFIQFSHDNVDGVDSLANSDLIAGVQEYIEEETERRIDEKEFTNESVENEIKLQIEQLTKSIEANDKGQYKTNLQLLKEDYKQSEASYLWRSKPKIWLEILFWAFFATILRLAINTGWYVSTKRFFSHTILYKLALLFVIPIVAMLISVVLSYISMTFDIGNSQIKLSLANPEVAIIIAVLIGLAPWRAWDFMKSLADTLFKKLGGLFGGGGGGNEA